MAHAYSTEGFDILIEDGILEMRTEGVRTERAGADPQRAFESLLASAPVRGILFDVRGANYDIDDVSWEARARTISRLCRDYPVGLVARPDQDDQIASIQLYHRERSGQSRTFRSRREARDWLRACMENGG